MAQRSIGNIFSKKFQKTETPSIKMLKTIQTPPSNHLKTDHTLDEAT